MASQNGESPELDIRVEDEEEYTDKKTKQRILNERDMLNEAQHELFSARLINPDVDYSQLDALMSWGNLVRSYLSDLSILLANDDLEHARYYRESVDLGSVQLVPPSKQGYDFGQIAYDGVTEEDLIREWPGFGRGAELPKPKTREFVGLSSLIKADPVVEAHWSVVKNPRASRPNQERLTLHAQQPVPKRIYEAALRQADQFLQECGIGLEISGGDYMADEGPGL